MDCMAGVRAEDLEERCGRLGCWSPLFPFRPEEDRLGADCAYQMGRWKSSIVEYTNSIQVGIRVFSTFERPFQSSYEMHLSVPVCFIVDGQLQSGTVLGRLQSF
jgi:hypothetical protein